MDMWTWLQKLPPEKRIVHSEQWDELSVESMSTGVLQKAGLTSSELFM